MAALLLTALLTGCGAEQAAQNTAAPALTCAPDTLRAGDTLQVHLSAPGSHLSLADPSGTVYYAFSDGAAHPLLAPALSARLDADRPQLALPIDSLQMKPVAYDARTAIPVFRRPGTYRLYLTAADNVADTTAADCTVEFVNPGN